MPDERSESRAPIQAPPSFSKTPTRSAGNRVRAPIQAPKRMTTKRKRRKLAGQTQKGALNLRRVATGFVILIAISLGFYLFVNPQTIPDLLSGKYFEGSETCTVTRTNTTNFFETDCGRFEWDTEALQGGSPAANLTVGQSYKFESTGVSIPISQTYPRVTKVEVVS